MVVRKVDILANLQFEEPGDIAGLTVSLLPSVSEDDCHEKSGCVLYTQPDRRLRGTLHPDGRVTGTQEATAGTWEACGLRAPTPRNTSQSAKDDSATSGTT